MNQIILEREPEDCPLRQEGGKCGIVFNRNDCETWVEDYPEWCPILNYDVVVRAARKVQE
jgi:hypothetical protein